VQFSLHRLRQIYLCMLTSTIWPSSIAALKSGRCSTKSLFTTFCGKKLQITIFSHLFSFELNFFPFFFFKFLAENAAFCVDLLKFLTKSVGHHLQGKYGPGHSNLRGLSVPVPVGHSGAFLRLKTASISIIGHSTVHVQAF
jgi:hypothetical protein